MPEVIVAIFLFSLVMTIGMGSIITLLNANRKTQSIKSVMNNLNLALDSMTKVIAVGKDYHCGGSGNLNTPLDCQNGATQMTFESNEDLYPLGNPDGLPDHITYSLQSDSFGGYIERKIDGGSATRMTAPEIDITKMRFFVLGTAPFGGGLDNEQPKVVILIEGATKMAAQDAGSSFQIQAMTSQRIPDNL